MLGGYPRLVTDARITSRMVRCRGVSVDSADREGRSESASGVLLSLIWPNVAGFRQDIKHVFEVCRVLLVRRPAKAVGGGFYRLHRVQQFDHMFGFRTHYRLCFEQVIDYKADWRNAHDAHRDDLAERADPSSADSGPPTRPARGTPWSAAVPAGGGASALPRHRSLDVDGIAS